MCIPQKQIFNVFCKQCTYMQNSGPQAYPCIRCFAAFCLFTYVFTYRFILLLFPHPVMLPGLKEAVQDQTYNTNGKQHINPYAVKAAFRQPPHNEDTHKCQRKQAAPF